MESKSNVAKKNRRRRKNQTKRKLNEKSDPDNQYRSDYLLDKEGAFLDDSNHPHVLIQFRQDNLALNNDGIMILRKCVKEVIIITLFGSDKSGKKQLLNILTDSKVNLQRELDPGIYI